MAGRGGAHRLDRLASRRPEGPLPVVPLTEILDRAFAERYGVAAFNVVNDLTLRGGDRRGRGGAVAGDRPDLGQDGEVDRRGRAVDHVPRDGRAGVGAGHPAPRPLPRARGHHDLPRGRLELGAVRRLVAVARGEHRARRSRSWPRRAATARTSRARSRASAASRTASARTRRARSTPSTRPWRSSSATGVDCFAPAIGTAHGVYTAEPVLDPQRVTDLVARRPGPDGAARRHRPDRGRLRRPDRRGCAKVNISTALKVTYLDSTRRFLRGRTRPSRTRRRSSASSAPR